MALHILQPGLRPIGQFDLCTGETVTGGEVGELREADAVTNSQGRTIAADTSKVSDVNEVGPLSNSKALKVALGAPTDSTPGTRETTETSIGLRFLLDEGTDDYGTLFGTMIGGAAGQGVRYGVTNSGAVTALGPSTALASGKVTCWHAPGLYGVSATAAANLAATTQVNTELFTTNAGILHTTAGDSDLVALHVGAMYDDSLVSTTLAAAGEDAAVAKYAIYFLGQR